MVDLTRADIEAIRDAEDDTGDYMYRHGTRAGRAITQLLRQLDAANADLETFKAGQTYRYIGKDGKPVFARDLEDRLDAANARADAATSKTRDAVTSIKAHVPLAMGARYIEGYRDAVVFYVKAILAALPLHEEPKT